jgi:riboflavin transporter FmnP
MAILTALSVVLVALIHFPIFPAVSFLEYDPADIPILICGFAFGPWAGLAVTVVASFIQGFTVSAASGIYGIIMHILATGVYVTVSSALYKHKKTKKEAILSIVAGTFSMALVMFGANLVITPYFMMGAVNGETVRAVLSLMPFIIAFNLIKAGINGTVTFFVYKKVSPIMKRDRRKG